MPASPSGSAKALSAPLKNTLVLTVRDLWIQLQKCAHAEDLFPTDARNSIAEVLAGGIFEWPRTIKKRFKEPISATKPETTKRLLELIESESHSGVVSKTCTTLSSLVDLLYSLRKAAADARVTDSERSRKLWIAYGVIRKSFFQLLRSKILADMPNTPRITAKDEVMLLKLGAALERNYTVMERAADSKQQLDFVKTILARGTGLSLFQAIRARDTGRTTAGSRGLIEWMERDLASFQRGFYADMALGIQELAEAADKLQPLKAKFAHDSLQAKQIGKALDVLSITIYEVIQSGVLLGFPS